MVIAALGVVQILHLGLVLLPARGAGWADFGDTGWPLQWIVGGLSVGLLVAWLVSPKMGALIDARGGRPVLAGEGCSGAVIPRPLSSPARAPEAIRCWARWRRAYSPFG